MINERHLVRSVVAALTLGICALAVDRQRARADGIPSTSPLVYSGNLQERGTPVNGSRNIRLVLWDSATSTDVSNSRCVTVAMGSAVTDGRFHVTLDGSCTAAVRATPDLWIEVEVNGASLGRTKLAAVPFAVEASRAAALTPAAENSLVPTGTVVAFAGGADRVPNGWLPCDGRSLARSAYPSLFASIGTAHGGTGANFNLPDLRGRFLRGVDNGIGRDPDRGARTAANPGGNTGDAVGSVERAATAMPSLPFTAASAGDHTHNINGVGDHTHNINAVGDHTHAQYITANCGTGGTGIRSDYNGLECSGMSRYAQGAETAHAGGHTHGMSAAGAHSHTASSAGGHAHVIGGGDQETRPVNVGLNYIIKI